MVKSTNLRKKEFKLILVCIISLLLFQSILPFLKADDLDDGPLEISTLHKSFNVKIGSNLTIYWNFSVPSHEYAVYWEIKGYGVNKNGWGIYANCTTPVITTNGSEWVYNCSGYYTKYHVWCTVSVIGYEEVSGRKNDGLDGIYTQKVNSNGVNRWDANGTAICRASGDQKNPQIVSDSTGGAIITWEESDVYAQRINSNGDIQWDLNGNAICTAKGSQEFPQIVSDGANNTIITWQDSRFGDYDIYAQKINSSGDIQWMANGTAICTANGSQKFPQLVNDGAGGIIITWQDNRDGDYDIYAQKINSSGDIQWIANGTTICTANGTQLLPQLIGDGANGTIITWEDSRNGNYDIFAQKVNSSGYIQWNANGTAICTANNSQLLPQLIGDGVNGTIISWQDSRDDSDDIYIQKVNSSGEIQWIPNGTAICTVIGNQLVPQLISDGANGTIITWQDNRDGNYDIYTQKINSNGEIQWVSNGKAVCTANGDQLIPQIISNGAGGAIITWDDNRVEVDSGDDDGNGDDDGDDDGDGDGDGEYVTDIPGFSLYLFIGVFSIIVIIKIITIHINSKKKKTKIKILS